MSLAEAPRSSSPDGRWHVPGCTYPDATALAAAVVPKPRGRRPGKHSADLRARILLLSSSGLGVTQVAEQVGCSHTHVSRVVAAHKEARA